MNLKSLTRYITNVAPLYMQCYISAAFWLYPVNSHSDTCFHQIENI